MILAALSAYFALTPLIYSAQKTRQMKEATQAFYEQLESMQKEKEQEPQRTNPNDHVPIPYENLYLDMRDYNKWLDATKQSGLNSREAYQDSYFDLEAYGLPDQLFGVIRIPRMDLEMSLYLGASYENMSNGASVLTQTSIPIGGENCNSVIAGHRMGFSCSCRPMPCARSLPVHARISGNSRNTRPMLKEASFEIRGSASGSPADTGDLCHRLQVCFLLGLCPQLIHGAHAQARQHYLRLLPFKELKTGDIIVFEHDGKLLVKRIAAYGGDIIIIHDKSNSVPEDSFFVLGDNVDNSLDSRYWSDPFVPLKDVVALIFTSFVPVVCFVSQAVGGRFLRLIHSECVFTARHKILFSYYLSRRFYGFIRLIVCGQDCCYPLIPGPPKPPPIAEPPPKPPKF